METELRVLDVKAVLWCCKHFNCTAGSIPIGQKKPKKQTALAGPTLALIQFKGTCVYLQCLLILTILLVAEIMNTLEQDSLGNC